jgi:putative endonuclease
MAHQREKGRKAEDQAENFLLNLGYVILTRNYTIRGGELDIVALDGNTIVFVEVKSRREGNPEEAVGSAKAEGLRKAARAYLRNFAQPESPHRFDMIAVQGEEIRHHQNFLG